MGAAILDCMTSLGNGLNYQQPNDVIKYNMAALMKAKNEGGSKIFFANKKIFIFNKLEINKAICLTFFFRSDFRWLLATWTKTYVNLTRVSWDVCTVQGSLF